MGTGLNINKSSVWKSVDCFFIDPF